MLGQQKCWGNKSAATHPPEPDIPGVETSNDLMATLVRALLSQSLFSDCWQDYHQFSFKSYGCMYTLEPRTPNNMPGFVKSKNDYQIMNNIFVDRPCCNKVLYYAGAHATDPVSTFSDCVHTQQQPIVRLRILSDFFPNRFQPVPTSRSSSHGA